MKRIIFSALALGLVLASCNSKSSWESQEESFMSGCTSSYVSSFKQSLGEEYLDQVNMEELDKIAESQCSCVFESMKAKYDTPEEALSKGIDALVDETEGCDPTEEDLDKLLK